MSTETLIYVSFLTQVLIKGQRAERRKFVPLPSFGGTTVTVHGGSPPGVRGELGCDECSAPGSRLVSLAVVGLSRASRFFRQKLLASQGWE